MSCGGKTGNPVSLLVYIDGEYLPQEEAKISVYDHGFLYGDGVFEGIRAYHGRVFKLDEHLDRLYRSARAIMLEIPLSREALRAAVLESLKRNRLSDGYVRLIVTRGRGDLGEQRVGIDRRMGQRDHGGDCVVVGAAARPGLPACDGWRAAARVRPMGRR